MSAGSPLRVLWVTPTIGEDFGGPTSTVVNGLIAERRAGIDSELATTIGAEESPERLDSSRRLAEGGVEVRHFRRTRLLGRGEAWGLSPRLAVWLFRNVKRYDVVHLQYVWCMTSIVGVIAARIAGVPVALTPHESLTEFDIQVASRHPVLKAMKRLLRHFYLHNTDQLVLMSRLEERDTRYEDVPAEIVSHAVLAEPVPEEERAPQADGLRIAFLGRNIEKKGIHLIVEALARHPERGRRLTIAGPPASPAYRRRLEGLIERFEVEDRVDWAGYVEDRTAYLRAADVVAMPSVYEGFGMVAAEAMCLGVGVIVPAASGVAELVEEFDAGTVLDQPSAESLDRAFAELEESPERLARIGANGLRAANARLTFQRFADRTGEIYRGLSGG